MDNYLKQITPVPVINRFEEMCCQRPDLRTLSYILGPDKILEWIHSIGICADGKLKALLNPIPPLELRSIVAAPEVEIFLWTGAVDIQQFITLYEKYKNPEDLEPPIILDFGCGCGRMSRYLNNKSRSYATDINPELVDWCRDNLFGVQTYVNGEMPPLSFVDQSFNFIYCLSVFTHLPEKLANLWLAEMHRVLAPKGTLIITTHGIPSLNVIKESKIHQDIFNMKPDDVSNILMHFNDKPFIFLNYSSDLQNIIKTGEGYGNTFIHHEFIKNNWNNKYFEVKALLEGGLRGWQDIVVLQRK